MNRYILILILAFFDWVHLMATETYQYPNTVLLTLEKEFKDFPTLMNVMTVETTTGQQKIGYLDLVRDRKKGIEREFNFVKDESVFSREEVYSAPNFNFHYAFGYILPTDKKWEHVVTTPAFYSDIQSIGIKAAIQNQSTFIVNDSSHLEFIQQRGKFCSVKWKNMINRDIEYIKFNENGTGYRYFLVTSSSMLPQVGGGTRRGSNQYETKYHASAGGYSIYMEVPITVYFKWKYKNGSISLQYTSVQSGNVIARPILECNNCHPAYEKQWFEDVRQMFAANTEVPSMKRYFQNEKIDYWNSIIKAKKQDSYIVSYITNHLMCLDGGTWMAFVPNNYSQCPYYDFEFYQYANYYHADLLQQVYDWSAPDAFRHIAKLQLMDSLHSEVKRIFKLPSTCQLRYDTCLIKLNYDVPDVDTLTPYIIRTNFNQEPPKHSAAVEAKFVFEIITQDPHQAPHTYIGLINTVWDNKSSFIVDRDQTNHILKATTGKYENMLKERDSISTELVSIKHLFSKSPIVKNYIPQIELDMVIDLDNLPNTYQRIELCKSKLKTCKQMIECCRILDDNYHRIEKCKTKCKTIKKKYLQQYKEAKMVFGVDGTCDFYKHQQTIQRQVINIIAGHQTEQYEETIKSYYQTYPNAKIEDILLYLERLSY